MKTVDEKRSGAMLLQVTGSGKGPPEGFHGGSYPQHNLSADHVGGQPAFFATSDFAREQ